MMAVPGLSEATRAGNLFSVRARNAHKEFPSCEGSP
jgi:hypothetical protein